MKALIFASALLFACPVLQPVFASPLSDVAGEAGVEWMIGSWATADGNVKVAYDWRLDKNAIGVKFAPGDREAEGMIALKPGTTTAAYMAVDNQGGISKGEWSEYQGNPLLKTTHVSSEGEKKTAVEHIKVDAGTMKIKVYKLNDSGDPGDLLVELEMTRAK